MFKFFMIHSITGKIRDIPNGHYAINTDPSYLMRYEEILICKKEMPTFDEVIDCLKKCVLKADYLGCYSLIYWTYYKEFYGWIRESFKQNNRANIKLIKKFYKQALLRWIYFIKHSDDTLYPQKEYFGLMKKEIEKHLQ